MGILLMVGVSTVIAIWQQNKQPRILILAWGYSLFAVLISFRISLKEPRHLIGILPMCILIIGVMIDWNRLLFSRIKLVVWAILGGFLLLASPAKLTSTTQIRHFETWWKPFPHHRLFEEKRNFTILAEVGRKVAELTEPDEIVSVVHEAPVVAYYANRPYLFLYTMDESGVQQALAKSAVLVEDRWLFPQLNEEEQLILREQLAPLITESIITGKHRDIPIIRLD